MDEINFHDLGQFLVKFSIGNCYTARPFDPTIIEKYTYFIVFNDQGNEFVSYTRPFDGYETHNSSCAEGWIDKLKINMFPTYLWLYLSPNHVVVLA